MGKWAIHACILDQNCQAAGAPNRLHLSTPWFFFAVALTPGSRFAGRMKEPWLSEWKAVPASHSDDLRRHDQREILRRAKFKRARWTDTVWDR